MTPYHRGCSVVEGEGSSCLKLCEIYFAATKIGSVTVLADVLDISKTRRPE